MTAPPTSLARPDDDAGGGDNVGRGVAAMSIDDADGGDNVGRGVAVAEIYNVVCIDGGNCYAPTDGVGFVGRRRIRRMAADGIDTMMYKIARRMSDSLTNPPLTHLIYYLL